jgi:hypothetical protein
VRPDHQPIAGEACPRDRNTANGWLGLLLAASLIGPLGPAQAGPLGKGFNMFQLDRPEGDLLSGRWGRLYPELRVEAFHHSNFFRTDGDIIPTLSTWVTVISPKLAYSTLTGDRGQRVYRAEYEANIGTVHASKDDNYVDQRFTTSGNWEIGSFSRVRAEYEFLRWHDRRGSGDPTDVSRPNLTSKHPDIWRSNRVEFGGSFTSRSKKTLADIGLTFYQRRYLNNNQERRNNDRVTADLQVFYALPTNMAPRTRLLFQLNWQDIDYVSQPPWELTLDSQELRVYTGVTWQRSVKTALDLRVGYLLKDYQAVQRTDQAGFAWEVEGRWRARPYGVLDLNTTRTIRESAEGFGDATLISAGTLTWTQYLRPNKHYYRLSAYATKDEYAYGDRIDHRYHLSAGIFGQFKRMVLFGLEYSYQTRDSDIPAAEYTDDVWMLHMDLKL